VLDKRAVDTDLKAMSQAERRTLKALGARIGAFSLFLPSVLRPRRRPAPGPWPPAAGAASPSAWPRPPVPSRTPAPLPPTACAWSAVMSLPVEMLEWLDALLREGQKPGGVVLTDAARDTLGWTPAEAAAVLRALDYTPAIRPKDDDPILWKRRGAAAPEAKVVVRPDSPFAALARLAEPPPRRKRPRRRKPAAVRTATGGAA
jgi:ATP-dependent RNA helicase SUPV3L1/SUV3